MSEFSNNIKKLISQNRVELAIDEIQKLLNQFKPTTDSGRAEARELETFFISLSQRLYQAKDNQKNGNLSETEFNTEKHKVSNQLTETVFDLDKYDEFNTFISTKEEELAWQNAKTQNTIAAYEDYFRMFPNQKFVQEPPRFLDELKNELRQKAEQERKGRNQEERKPEQKFTASSYSGSVDPMPAKKSNSKMMMMMIGGVVVVIIIIIVIVVSSGNHGGESIDNAMTNDTTAIDGSNGSSSDAIEQNNSTDQNNSVQQDNSNGQGTGGNESTDNSQAGGDQNNSNEQSGTEDTTQAQ